MHFGIIASVSLGTLLGTQAKFTQYGGHTERGSTRVAYWNNETNEAVGQVAIDFGRPLWKEQYETQFDAMTQGKIWRMGDNFWSSLDTNIPVTIGGVEVPVGYYYLAVKRSEDGDRWRLALFDPSAAREHVLDAFEVATRAGLLSVRLEVPLAFETSGTPVEKLTVELTEERLAISWGKLVLSAPVAVAHR